ncbi:MAG: hypothetical protein ACI8W7_003388 [Gammaproteobacteria bacterium]
MLAWEIYKMYLANIWIWVCIRRCCTTAEKRLAPHAPLTREVEQAMDLRQVSMEAAAQRIRADFACAFRAFRQLHLARNLMAAQR